MHRDTDVSRRRQISGAQRTVDEIEIRDAGELLESKWNLELARAHLHGLADVRVHVDVLPRGFLRGVRLVVFPFGQLTLDGELHTVEELAFDPDARAMNLEVVEVRRVVTGMARVPLKLRDEVEAEHAARTELRVIAPAKFDIRRRRLLRNRRRRRRRGRGGRESDWQERHQSGKHTVQHAASPSAIGGTLAASLAATNVNRPAISAIAAGSVTVSATSRRKSRLIGLSDSPPITARRSSTSMTLPCERRPHRRLASYNSTRTPAAERAWSNDINAGSDAFLSISRMLDEASSMIDVN